MVLEQECGSYRPLAEVAAQIRRRTDFFNLSREAVIAQVREVADSHYHALWTILEQDEKLVVVQLAHGVVVNPVGKRAVRRLLARRIVVRTPELRLVNESFQRFLREEVPAALIEEWGRGEPSSAWQRLRFPIGIALLALVAYLFVTQRTAFNNALAMLTAASVGIPAILKILAATRSGEVRE